MVTELQNKVKQYRAEVIQKQKKKTAKACYKKYNKWNKVFVSFKVRSSRRPSKKEADLLKPIFEKAKAGYSIK